MQNTSLSDIPGFSGSASPGAVGCAFGMSSLTKAPARSPIARAAAGGSGFPAER